MGNVRDITKYVHNFETGIRPYRESQKVNGGQKLVRLHMSYLIRPTRAHWYDFCHTKNSKFASPLLPPINRLQCLYPTEHQNCLSE